MFNLFFEILKLKQTNRDDFFMIWLSYIILIFLAKMVIHSSN
jgi:hypothetical protein